MSKCVPKYLRSPAVLGAPSPSPSFPGGAVGTWQRGGKERKVGIDTGVSDGHGRGAQSVGPEKGL